MKWMVAATLIILVNSSCTGDQGMERTGAEREPVVGLPCEGCEGVFVGLPDSLTSRARLAPRDEPGEPLRIEGTVVDDQGDPAANVVVYAYQTDANGIYPANESLRGTPASTHGRLRGWVKTDEQGNYHFDTIKPGSYPGREIPAHVHMHIIEVGRCTYYIDSIEFDDDPFLSAQDQEHPPEGRGGSGRVTLRQDASGVWVAHRDIVLGQAVPGYPPSGSNHY